MTLDKKLEVEKSIKTFLEKCNIYLNDRNRTLAGYCQY